MPGLRDKNRKLLSHARQMRRDPTDVEKKLWSILRSNQLAGFKFRRQHPVDGYILDFFCIKYRLAIECDGGQHLDTEEKRYDEIREAHLREHGIQILRFSNIDVLKTPDIVAEAIYQMLTARTEPSPQPSPGVPGEGVMQ